MANDKEIIKKLFAIVEKQQKIIVKMAQAATTTPSPFTGQPAPPPQELKPGTSTKKPAAAILEAMPELRSKIVNLEERGPDMLVRFKPGQSSDANFNAILSKMQELTNANVLPHAFNLKEV
jgi:hypothetical protein